MEQSENPQSLLQRRLPAKTVAVILFILLPIGGFYLGMTYQKNITHLSQSASQEVGQQSVNSQSKFVCTQYGISKQSEYLQKYTVKSGDTLLSIAKTQLHDPSRVTELINLNSDAYPSLSIKTPFLETGWVLYVPDKTWTPSSGNIVEIKGEVTEIQPNGKWVLQGPEFASDLKPLSTTILPNRKVKVGDCIKAIREKGTEGNLIKVSFLQ